MLDAEEFGAAVDGLTAEDKLKLTEIEKIHLRGTDLKKGDLLHEAVCAGVLGDRKCPRRVPVMAFIVKSMQSIASHRREKHARETADGGAALEKAEARMEDLEDEVLCNLSKSERSELHGLLVKALAGQDLS